MTQYSHVKYTQSPTPSVVSGYSSASRLHSPLPPPANHRRDCLSATTKSYKYLRRLLKFNQMDFEFALWQMLYLFVAPQRCTGTSTTGNRPSHSSPATIRPFWSSWSSAYVVSSNAQAFTLQKGGGRSHLHLLSSCTISTVGH